MKNKIIKGYGEVAVVKYEDYDDKGLVCQGVSWESEEKGTLLKVEKHRDLKSLK